MGLDISAHSNVIILGTGEYAEALEDDESTKIDGEWIEQDYINPSFPHAVPPEWRDKGRYLRWRKTPQSKRYPFRAGSYAAYSQFRSTLCEQFSNREIWDNPEKFAELPFVHLINFSDCEGVMTGPVCERLYQDFVENRATYVSKLDTNDWFDGFCATKYDDWTCAFELARQDGLVRFY